MRNLVRAARELLETSGPSGFSMRDLARHAGVSPATPYNLFGTKAAILQAALEADVRSLHSRMSEGAGGEPISNLVFAIGHLARTLSKRPDYYRGLTFSLSSLGADETRRFVDPLAQTLLSPIVRGLEQGGMLNGIIPPSALDALTSRQIGIVIFRWLTRDWDEGRLCEELQLAIGSVLLGSVKEPARSALIDLLRSLKILPGT
jgi:AcrR family transcriptional regulator